MPSPSNLYAEKIFSEHPLSLWTLDEEFENGTTGQTVSDIKNVSSFKGIKALAYGKSSDFGWYVGDSSYNYYADNSGVPMVFGAYNVTGLYPHATAGQPSLLIPGKGFLNNTAKYKDLTLEFWVRPTVNTVSGPFRIVGPVASSDGIYVDGSFIKIKVGDNIGSHFIQEWQRPMLVQFTITKSGATLNINGDQVISIKYDISKIALPDSVSNDDKEQDWIGFYLDEQEVSLMDVDCIAIYPTTIPDILAKRRFAYGQAVQYPQNLLANYGGSAVILDYSFANYSKNFNYPTMGRWSNGSLSNIKAKSDFLTVPDYKLPQLVISKNQSTVSTSVWNADNMAVQSGTADFIRIKPTSEYDNSYIKFNSLEILLSTIESVFGLFQLSSAMSSEELLLKIHDNFSGRYISVVAEKIDENTANILTTYFDGDTINELSSVSLDPSAKFFAGIDVDKFSTNSLLGSSEFFNSPANLSLYVGGDESQLGQFSGNLYKLYIANSDSKEKFSQYISTNSNGSISATNPDVASLNSSYTLIPKIFSESFSMDIGIDGFWQDYVPLSYMTKRNDVGEYSFDFMQFNVGYHSTKTYDTDHFESSKDFKTYVSFQTTASGAQDNPASVVLMGDGLTVEPGTNWDQEKYEVFDNSIIYPPSVDDIEALALVIRLDFSIDGIISNPVVIKSLEIASRTSDINQNTPVGSRLGVDLIPYQGQTEKNPFLIYKESSPYLYMTDKSGIKLCGTLSNDMTRGIKLDVNSAKSPSYNVSSVQMFVKYNGVSFKTKEPMFEIINKKSGFEHLKFYTVADAGNKTAKIKGYVVNPDSSETLLSGVNYYIDGHKIADGEFAQLELNEWHIFDVNFPKLIDFGDGTGYSINLTGPEVFNNISYYRVSDDAVQQKTKKITWQSVYEVDNVVQTWDDWTTQTWSNILYEEFQDIENIDPTTVYNIYLGVNKIIVDTDRSQDKLSLNGYQYSIYSDVSWQSEVIKPV